jgi:hypothetical protein
VSTVSRPSRYHIEPIAAVIFGLWLVQSKEDDKKRMDVYEDGILVHYEDCHN